MTREKAIKELKILKEDYWDDDGYGHETKQYDDTMLALDMAIKALEQEPCREADDYENEISDLYNRLDIVEYDKERLREEVTTLEEKLKGLSAEPCDDVISRQAVIDVIERWLECSGYNEAERHIMRAVQSVLYDLPSVKPQESKTGHWEWVQYDYNPKLGNWHCSECRSIAVKCVDKNEKGGIPLYKYCPNCGAKMVKPQESEE